MRTGHYPVVRTGRKLVPVGAAVVRQIVLEIRRRTAQKIRRRAAHKVRTSEIRTGTANEIRTAEVGAGTSEVLIAEMLGRIQTHGVSRYGRFVAHVVEAIHRIREAGRCAVAAVADTGAVRRTDDADRFRRLGRFQF